MRKQIVPFVAAIITVLIFHSCTIDQTTEPQYEIVSYNWEYALPADVGLNTNLIYRGIDEAQFTGFMNSVLVIKNSKIVGVGYLNNSSSSAVYDVKSVTKSFVSAFAGIAVSKGLLNLDQKLTDFYPLLKNVVGDKRINDITVRHLLTMTSGLKSDDVIFPNETIINWVEYILSFPLDTAPGTVFRYSDTGAYLVSAIITKATGKNTFEFAKENFFNPLDFSLQGWYYSPDGIPIGGSTMKFTTKNMAVLGLLYMNKGKLNGKQIIPEEWVNASVTDYMNWTGEEWGALKKVGYGFFWWTGEMNGYKVFSAVGYGGQLVFCIPALDMIIAVCSDSNVNSMAAGEHTTRIMNLISEYFIPAAQN